MKVSSQLHTGTLEFQGNYFRHPLDKTLSGPHSRLGRFEKRQYFASQLLTTADGWSSPWPSQYTDNTPVKLTRKGPTAISVSTAKYKLRQTYLTSMTWYLLERRTNFRSKTRLSQCRIPHGARGSAVGWGTALQAGRSRVRFPMVSLEIFIHIILPAALWPWGWLNL